MFYLLEFMSRYVYQNVHFISSSSDDEYLDSTVGRANSANSSSKKPRKNKRRRPNRLLDNWKKVSPLKYLSSSAEEDQSDSKSNKGVTTPIVSETITNQVSNTPNKDTPRSASKKIVPASSPNKKASLSTTGLPSKKRKLF